MNSIQKSGRGVVDQEEEETKHYWDIVTDIQQSRCEKKKRKQDREQNVQCEVKQRSVVIQSKCKSIKKSEWSGWLDNSDIVKMKLRLTEYK